MTIKIPLYKQEKDNTCALACLRMVLAAFGTDVEESELESNARVEAEGIPIDELERLARQYDLGVEELGQILTAGKFPIAFIDRAVFDLSPQQRRTHSICDAIIHTVVPVRATAQSITFHDPRPPSITRKTLRLFRRAYSGVRGRSVVCSKPEEA